jgi:hypothetical protein
MTKTMPTATAEEEGEGDNPAFDRLLELYACLGLSPDHADAAAKADLACGWQPGLSPADVR